ncbi:MAG: ABC transporter permease [Tannerella sp.]|jgi:putative ABC transport system permease protein|nr:ABC transporter permease [Tannerella sp.]
MFIHYFKIASRNMWKYKTQSLTGIFGLAFGIACFVPALYWMRHEMSYDSFYPGAEHIYRTYVVDKQSGKVTEMVPEPLVRALREEFPATEASTGFYPETNAFSAEGTPFIRLHTLLTDNAFFSVFPQKFVSGDTQQPLQALYNIVLTETMAIRLFGDAEKAIGQQIQSLYYFFYPPYTVTAVVKDPPPNSNLPFDAIIFYHLESGLTDDVMRFWHFYNTQAYVRLQAHTDINGFAEQLRDYTSRLGVNTDIELRMLPVSDVRHELNTNLMFTLNFIRLLVAAGVLLIFSALFNFLNLHLSLFHQRIRELRQRAVHGATIGQLIVQMMFELACSTLLALALACCFVIIARPVFSGLLNSTIETSFFIHLFAVCGAGVMALMLFIGFIPLWRLSWTATQRLAERKTRLQPVRRMAVTLQLAVSVVFIVAALVIMMQMRFVNQKDLGFDRSGIIQLSGMFSWIKTSVRTALIHELETIPQITGITTSNFEPQHNAKREEMVTVVEWPGKPPLDKPAFNVIPTDSRFAETLKLNMLMGGWWNEAEGNKIVLNEEAVRVMGLHEPVGTIIRMSIHSLDDVSMIEEYEIAGVVKDFHTLSLRSRIHPTIFRQSSVQSNFSQDNILYIRVVPGQEQEVIRRITDILPGIDPVLLGARLTPIDELYDRLNQSEQTGFKLFSVLATVCLLISLLGIYAVATASTRRRRKEIAIRKVVGAEVSGIIRMFFREYTSQVIMAGVVALPLAYLAMHRWLQGYAYRTNIPWWLLAGVIAGVIAVVLLTVLGQVWKAANSNPAEVVKIE